MTTPEYEIIIVGSGASGASLAHHLARGARRRQSILIVDKNPAPLRDRLWCTWSGEPAPFEETASYSWSRLHIATESVDRTFDLGRSRYRLLRGADLQRLLHEQSSAIDVLTGTVERIDDGPQAASVIVEGRTHTGTWVFDSRPRTPMPARRQPSLWQRFLGWQVISEGPAFNPAVATLLDFRTPQRGAMRFFYVLPFSEREAFVELVVCGSGSLSGDEGREALDMYLREAAGITKLDARVREVGATLLTTRIFPRRLGRHLMAIGAAGGLVKPSTGYGFAPIQRDSAAIVASLDRHGHPFVVPAPPRRFRWYDAAMLDVMAREGESVAAIFATLFTRNPVQRVLRFLDQRSSPWDELCIARTLPARLAARTLVR